MKRWAVPSLSTTARPVVGWLRSTKSPDANVTISGSGISGGASATESSAGMLSSAAASVIALARSSLIASLGRPEAPAPDANTGAASLTLSSKNSVWTPKNPIASQSSAPKADEGARRATISSFV